LPFGCSFRQFSPLESSQCAYAAQQRDFGNVEGQVMRVLGDAYRMLGLEQADFRPVP
jgi:hypothetical protein